MKWMVLALLALSLRSFAADTVVFGNIPEDSVVLTGTGMTNLVNAAIAAIPAESDPSAYPISTNALAVATNAANAAQAALTAGTNALAQAQAAGIAASNAAVVADAALTAGGGTNVALSVVGAFATTGTVSRATVADMLRSANGESWLTYGTGGEVYLVSVTNTPSVYVVSTSGDGYNGPAAGTLWNDMTYVVEFETFEWRDEADQVALAFATTTWSLITTSQTGGVWEATSSVPLVLPTTMMSQQSQIPECSFILDWVPATNVYQVATEPTVITITQNAVDAHNSETNTAAHPTLARKAELAGYVPLELSVTGAVSTAQSGYRYYWTTATNVVLSASLTDAQVVNLAMLRNTATNSVTAIGAAGWVWTGGAMTNTIPAGRMMTFGWARNPMTGATNAYATAASVN